MNFKSRFVACGILFAMLGSCRPPDNPLMEAERKLVADSVRQTLERYYRDISTEGLLAEFKYLDSTSGFYWVPPGFTSAISYDSVSSILRRSAKMLRSVDNVWDTLRIDPLTSNLATYTGRLNSTVVDTAGNTTITSLVETGVLIRRPGGWKLLSGQTSIAAQE